MSQTVNSRSPQDSTNIPHHDGGHAFPSLHAEIGLCSDRLIAAVGGASAKLRQVRASLPADLYTGVMLDLCALANESQRLKMLLGTLRMVGGSAPRPIPTRVEDLELFGHEGMRHEAGAPHGTGGAPVAPLQRSLSAEELESLHRAGDRTLDPTEEAAA